MATVQPQAFLAVFDALHREIRLALGLDAADFEGCVRAVRERRLCTREDQLFLDQCKHIRNFLAHTHDVITTGLVDIAIDQRAVERLDLLRERFAEKLLATRFMVPMAKVLSARPDDLLEPLMRKMASDDFTHLPVLEDGRISGVFDEHVLFRALAENRLDSVTPHTRVTDVVDPFGFDRVKPQNFGVIFASRKVSVAELRHKMEAQRPHANRISLIFITETGKQTEKPLGILTIWDLPFDQ